MASHKVSNLIFLSLFALSVALFLFLSHEFQESELISRLDKLASRLMRQARSQTLTRLAIPLTDLGSAKFLTLFVTFAGAAIAAKQLYRACLLLVLSGVLAPALTIFLKLHFLRARPDSLPHLVTVDGFSYPSGHSLSATAIYMTAAILVSQMTRSKTLRIGVLSIGALLSVGIAASRVYLGVHYFSDVVAGISLGIAIAAATGAISRKIEETSPNHR